MNKLPSSTVTLKANQTHISNEVRHQAVLSLILACISYDKEKLKETLQKETTEKLFKKGYSPLPLKISILVSLFLLELLHVISFTP